MGLFFWQTLLFVILVFVLRKYAWKPILTAVEEREDGIKNALSSAEKAKIKMENLNADNERILAEARIERDALLKEAREIKEELVNDAKKVANTESEKIITLAREQINNEKIKAVNELKNSVAELSVEIAEKIIKSELSDKNKQAELIEKAINNSDLN